MRPVVYRSYLPRMPKEILETAPRDGPRRVAFLACLWRGRRQRQERRRRPRRRRRRPLGRSASRCRRRRLRSRFAGLESLLDVLPKLAEEDRDMEDLGIRVNG